MTGTVPRDPRSNLDLSRLEALIERIRAINFGQGAEQATREMAVNPVIDALGWDTFNPAEVDREYSVVGGRVDYCLREPDRPLVLIEVKRAGTDLDDHEEQLLRYAFAEGVPLAALSNGLVWWLYLPRAEGTWRQRRFFRIDLLESDPASVASVLHRFLNHDGLMNGSALQEAQREFDSQERDRRLRAAPQQAWVRMLSDPESLLREELSETVHEISGHVPDDDLLDEFLADVSGSEDAGSDPLPRRRRRDTSKVRTANTEPGAFTPPETKERRRSSGNRPSAIWLDGHRHEVTSWRGMLVKVCEVLAKEPGPPFPERVAGLRGRKSFYFSSTGAELRTPARIPGLDLFVEGNVSALSAERLARRTVRVIRGSDEGFRITTDQEADSASTSSLVEETTGTPAALPAAENVTGLQPAAFWLDGERHEVDRWVDVLYGICSRLAVEAGAIFGQKVAALRGRNRLYFSKNPDDLHRALPLERAGLYVEGNFSANQCVRISRRVLIAVRGADDGFSIDVRESPASC